MMIRIIIEHEYIKGDFGGISGRGKGKDQEG
jgi:hypothetical protein